MLVSRNNKPVSNTKGQLRNERRTASSPLLDLWGNAFIVQMFLFWSRFYGGDALGAGHIKRTRLNRQLSMRIINLLMQMMDEHEAIQSLGND